MTAREFPYEKNVLLNSAYDVLEKMQLPLQYCDSRSGVLRFLCETGIGEMGFTAILRERKETTRLGISGAGKELPATLFDEIASTLRRNFPNEERQETLSIHKHNT